MYPRAAAAAACSARCRCQGNKYLTRPTQDTDTYSRQTTHEQHTRKSNQSYECLGAGLAAVLVVARIVLAAAAAAARIRIRFVNVVETALW
jgi:hypothetical protein